MNCPRCQHENETSAKFCEECAAPLARSCGNCGRQISPTAKFCPECAHPTALATTTPTADRFASPESYTPRHLAEKILTSKAALEGERKQVTVLFADLKGSMELLADRDPEEARKLLDPVLDRMMEAVHRYEGTVNQVMGDGIMALFGAPLAHEDHAVRACYAALRMQESVTQYAEGVFRSHGVPIQIRVGLNSGEVVVRAIGSDLHMDYTAVGQTTHLAARMEQMATPGTILLAPATLQLAEGYVQVAARGPVAVKGLADPVEVYALTGASAQRTRLHATAARGLTRFVGRDAEIEQIRRALALAHEGHGQLVALVGEPGVGKSRLVYEFTRSHRTQDWLVLEVSSVPYGKATSYLPVIDLLKAYFKVHDRESHREIREKVTGKVLTLDRSLEPILPALLALLDVPVEDAHWQALDPPERRQRTLDAVKHLLLREGQQQPVLVVFEDLHWIDAETQALLDGLVESLPSARVLLLVNYRPEYQHGWVSKTYYSQLRLDALPPESAGELLSALLGDDPALEPLKRLLVRRGNPLFIEESIRTLVETGALTGERGAYRLTRPIQTIEVPATVQVILAARIDRLATEDKQLLQTASVIGKDVPFVLLHAVAEAAEDAVQRGLAHLQAAEFLYETRLFPDPEYTFKHALTHDVTYGTLLQERRKALHARIVGALEGFYPDRLPEHVEQLAHHAFRGELWDKAVMYLRRAGVKAVARSALREAVGFFERASTALARLPESEQTLRTAIDIHLDLGAVLASMQSASAPEVEALYLQTRELVDRLGDPSRLFPVLWGLWSVHIARGRYPDARDLAERLLHVAQSGDEAGQLLEAHHALWSTLTAMGVTRGALTHAERGLALYDPARHGSQASLYGGHDAGVCCRSLLAVTRWLLGLPDQALAPGHEGLRLAETLAHPPSIAGALWCAVWLHYERGDRGAASASAERLVSVATAHNLRRWLDEPIVLLALTTSVRHELGGLDHVHRRAAATRTARVTWREVAGLCRLAEAYGEVDQPERGLGVLDWITAEHADAFYAPEILRVRGELLLLRAVTDEAERCFRRAIEIATRREEKSLELRAAMSLARLLARRGERVVARQVLTAVYGRFNEGFGTVDLLRAKTLLEEVT